MTTGEYLVAHSTLPSGTALQHLLALQIGTGQTVFCSQFVVTVEQPELVVTRRAKRRVAPESAQVARAPFADKQQKHITAFHSESGMSVFFDGPDEITVHQRTASVVASHKLDNRIIHMKGGA